MFLVVGQRGPTLKLAATEHRVEGQAHQVNADRNQEHDHPGEATRLLYKKLRTHGHLKSKNLIKNFYFCQSVAKNVLAPDVIYFYENSQLIRNLYDLYKTVRFIKTLK